MSENKSTFRPAVFPADIMYDDNLDALQRWVLTVLFTYTNSHTNSVFPSYETIAKRTGYSRRTVMRIVTQLIEKGYISKKKKRFDQEEKTGKLNQKSNEYTLVFKEIGRDAGKLESDDLEDGSVCESLGNQEKGSVRESLVTDSHQGSVCESPKLSNELSSITTTTCDEDLKIMANAFEKELGRPLRQMGEYEPLQCLINEYGKPNAKDIFLYALKIASSAGTGKLNMGYIQGIINRWGDIKTLQEAMHVQEEYESTQQKDKFRQVTNSKNQDKSKQKEKYNNFYR